MRTKSNIQLILEKTEGIQNLTGYIEQYLSTNNIQQGLLIFKEGKTIFKHPEVLKNEMENGNHTNNTIYTCIRGFHKPFDSIRKLVNEVYEYGNGILLEKGFSIGVYDNRENNKKTFYLMENQPTTIELVGTSYGKYLEETGLNHLVGNKKIMVYNENTGYSYL